MPRFAPNTNVRKVATIDSRWAARRTADAIQKATNSDNADFRAMRALMYQKTGPCR